MAHTHLGHNWYLYDINNDISDWILECLSEYVDFVQPYDTMYLRAKQCPSGKREYHVVFSSEYGGYRFPVCYLLDLNTGKFKGNKMHYRIDKEGNHYSDLFPVYSDRFRFDLDSKYYREYKPLRVFLNSLEIPDPVPSSKERHRARSRARSQSLPDWRIGHRDRKRKKGILLRDIKVS
jgi:hypothetical protein